MDSLCLLVAAIAAAPLLQSPDAPPRGELGIDRSHGIAEIAEGLRAGGRDWEATFDARGVTYVPALGLAAPMDQTLRIEARSVSRSGTGATPIALVPAVASSDGKRVAYARGGGVTERYDVGADGLELSFRLEHEVQGSGDLIVRCALGGNLAAYARPAAGGGLTFDGPYGGAFLGAVTGIDADGRRSAGSLRASGDALELVLPAEFVDAASWPVVVDPLLGPTFDVTTEVWEDDSPDVAYDDSTSRYLVVWRRTFAADHSEVRGQRLDSIGNPVGGTIFFDALGYGKVTRPRVANVNASNRFVVAWMLESLALQNIRIQACSASSGVLSDKEIVDTASTPCLEAPDIGGSARNEPTLNRVIVAYRRSCGAFAGIVVAPAVVPATGAMTVESRQSLALDATLISQHEAPSISKTGGVLDRWLVAWRRRSFFPSSTWNIRAAAIDSTGLALTPAFAVTSTSDTELAPDVDGGASVGQQYKAQYAVLYDRDVAGSLLHELELTSLAIQNGALVKTGSSIPATSTQAFSDYAVAWTPGMTTATWSAKNLLSNLHAISVQDFDGGTAQPCRPVESLGTVTPTSGGVQLGIASVASGGNTDLGAGLVSLAYRAGAFQGDVFGRRFDALSTNGYTMNVGGSCGLGGTIVAQGDPSIGNGAFKLTLTGADPNSLFTIRNLSVSLAAFPCGPCLWLPFKVTKSLPTLNGGSQTILEIPCDASLVGLTVGVQFTTVTPGTSPCFLSNDVSVSDILHVTFGG
jgi:hypothetical protein